MISDHEGQSTLTQPLALTCYCAKVREKTARTELLVQLMLVGRFAYKSFRLQVVSPTPRSIRLQDQSRFAYNEVLN